MRDEGRRTREEGVPEEEGIDSRIAGALLDWYDREARALPWRAERDPYRIWVSEVMLQQTRVETALPYYLRWIDRFPDLPSLADAELEEVLLFWAGLGYYRRARNLHQAARKVLDRWGGEVPREVAEFRRLPGVGAYTAGAVLSIAFGCPEPAVDGNVRRVLSRLFDEARPTPGFLDRRARALLDPSRPGDFNQALMELGAVLCTPGDPACERCPVRPWCRAEKAGTIPVRPPPLRRASLREESVGVAVRVAWDGRTGSALLLLRRRPETGLLAGMWEFPAERIGMEDSPEEKHESPLAAAARACGIPDPPPPDDVLPADTHLFSHLKVTYHPFLWLERREGDAMPEGEGAKERGAGPAARTPESAGTTADRGERRWIPFTPGEGFPVPLPAAQRRIAESAVGLLRSAEDMRGRGPPDA